jgi:aminoglycoside/choline kinase family phosphotransferase
MNSRYQHLENWLKNHPGLSDFRLDPMTGDASFRRYFRVFHANGTYVAMDAPPEKERCDGFIAIAKALRQKGLYAPEIFAADLSQGFLLLSDFGDQLFLKELNQNNAEKLYDSALSALSILQTCQQVDQWTVPVFTEQFMRQELSLFKEWFLDKYLKINLNHSLETKLSNCFDFLAKEIAKQKYVFMHRDYHSANLLLLPHNHVGILDFQDAFMGPVTYDVASLLRDCYIDFPENIITKLALNYRGKISLPVSDDTFLRDFDLMSLQRHLKALLTFSRKYVRDQNDNYLRHIPRTLNYISTVSSRYPECAVLNEVLKP